MITKNSCKKILKSTGMKVEKVVTLKLREYLDGLAFKIADELKKLAQHNGRRTIQKADFDFVIEKFYVGDKNG